MGVILIWYLVAVNVVALIQMQQDKSRAVKEEWRISEKQLWIVTLIGGSLGSYLGMKWFRHKTKHTAFVIGVPSTLIAHCFLVVFVTMRY
ncbi:DUF1294 domain-containing protein [Pontibacillus sp. ALD_SL1]|uniref:DUF1294 domain-containing protein n=1 Tax=Pontibacillus sp. ALD_SL1 TaxID=2777185 RepID=UPI001A961084|nr:DUF1294 domain-containing protein [Pontibacillus sp. ALD_SL1]QSS99187.1 DUF1294 domain-containing protein [Pontibacillus sp. ALD_SL1]